MHRRISADASSQQHSTLLEQSLSSPHSSQIQYAATTHHRPHLRHSSTHIGDLPISSGSLSSKLPQHPSAGITTSSHPQGRSSDTPLTSIKSPRSTSVPPDVRNVPLSPVTSPPVQASALTAPESIPPCSTRTENPTASYLSSVDGELSARASILAWAKLTTSGPPRNTPSPTGSALLTHSSSDEDSDRESITRPVGHTSIPSILRNSHSGLGSGTSSGDEESAENSPPAGEHSGNVADVESAGSVNDDLSPVRQSPLMSPPLRVPIIPFSMSALANQPHASVTSSESPSPALVVSHPHDHQVRLDRREHRHPPQYSNLPGHRDRERERRLRSSNPTPPTGPPNATAHSNTVGVTATNAHYTHPQRGRLRFIPDVPLPPPPPPLGPFRPLQLAPTTGGVDVLEEIARTLHTTRKPLVRTGADSDGDCYGPLPLGPSRPLQLAPTTGGVDVLGEIARMLHTTRKPLVRTVAD